MAFATDTIYTLGSQPNLAFVFGSAEGTSWDGPTSIAIDIETGDISYDDASTVIAVSGDAYRSTSNGSSFAIETIPVDVGVFTIAFGLSMFFAGGFGAVGAALITSSGNGTWVEQTTPFTADLGATVNSSFFNEFNSTMFIGGTQGSQAGFISLSIDGSTWSANKPNTFTSDGTFFAAPKDFASNDSNIIIAGGHKGIAGASVAHAQRSIDGGNTWGDITLDSFGGANSDIVTAAGNSNVLLLAGNDDLNTAHLERSIDQGITWNAVDVTDFIANAGSINDIKWSSQTNQFILVTLDGTLGPITATSPSGAQGTWTVQSLAYPAAPLGAQLAVAIGTSNVPPPTQSEPERLVRDPWDIDEWGRFYPGAGFHKIT